MTEREMCILFGETVPAQLLPDSPANEEGHAVSPRLETAFSPNNAAPRRERREEFSPAEVTREEERTLLEGLEKSSRNSGAFLRRLLSASDLFSEALPADARNRG